MEKKIFIMLSLLFAVSAMAKEKYAVIISARSGNQLLSDINLKYVKDTLKIFDIIKIKNVTTFFEGGNDILSGSKDITTEGVLAHLEKLSTQLKDDDELWVFFYGHSNISRRGISIPTNTRRLKGNSLLENIDKIKGKQLIFCFNTQSSIFMDLFSKKNRVVVTATNDIGQLNPPLFPKYFLNSWLEFPKNSLLKTLQSASIKTKEYFEKNLIGASENAQVFDGENLFLSPFKENTQLAKIKFDDDKIPVNSTLDDIALEINNIVKKDDAHTQSNNANIREANQETIKLVKSANITLKKTSMQYINHFTFLEI